MGREMCRRASGVPFRPPPLPTGLSVPAAAKWGALALVLGPTAGTLCEVCFLAAALRLHGIRVTPVPPRWTQPARQVLTQYLPMAIGSIMLGGSNLIDQMMAATLTAGSVSALNFGTRVTGVIIAIGPTALSTAILPRFSKMTALADWRGVRRPVAHSA